MFAFIENINSSRPWKKISIWRIKSTFRSTSLLPYLTNYSYVIYEWPGRNTAYHVDFAINCVKSNCARPCILLLLV